MSDKTKPTILLEHYLKKLKLPTLLREYQPLAVVCREERSDYPTYLLRLTERELLDRERRAAERRIKEAGFPVVKTLDTFAFKAQPSINEALACALAFAACAQGRRVRFYTLTALVTELLECREEKKLQRLHRQLARLQLIVLDELGYVPFSKAGAELLFEVVSRAYERQSLMVTTNLPFEQWTEVLGSERLTGALLDRLTHRIHILEANGESYRLRQSRKRREGHTPTDPKDIPALAG